MKYSDFKKKFKHGDFVKATLNEGKVVFGQVIQYYESLRIFYTSGKFSKTHPFGFEDWQNIHDFSSIVKISYRTFRTNISDTKIGRVGPPKEIVRKLPNIEWQVRSKIRKENNEFSFGCGEVQLTREELEVYAEHLDPNSKKQQIIRKIDLLLSRRGVSLNFEQELKTGKALKRLLKDSEYPQKKVPLKDGKRKSI